MIVAACHGQSGGIFANRCTGDEDGVLDEPEFCEELPADTIFEAGLILGFIERVEGAAVDTLEVFVGALVGVVLGLRACPILTMTFLNKLKSIEPKPVAGSHPGVAW